LVDAGVQEKNIGKTDTCLQRAARIACHSRLPRDAARLV